MAPNFIVLRKEQLDRLGDPAVAEYQGRMAKWIQRDFPDDYERLGDEGARSLVLRARERAAAYGMGNSVDVTGVLSLMLVLGEDFDTRMGNEWMKPILESSTLTGGEKTRTILRQQLDNIS